MLKEKIRKRKWRANIRKGPVKYKKYKEDEKLIKWVAKKPKQANTQMTIPQPNGKNSATANNWPPNSGSSFYWKQTLHYSITRADWLLPQKIPNKKTEVIQRLLTKYKLRINLKKIEKDVVKGLIKMKRFVWYSFELEWCNVLKGHVYIGKFSVRKKQTTERSSIPLPFAWYSISRQ